MMVSKSFSGRVSRSSSMLFSKLLSFSNILDRGYDDRGGPRDVLPPQDDVLALEKHVLRLHGDRDVQEGVLHDNHLEHGDFLR